MTDHHDGGDRATSDDATPATMAAPRSRIRRAAGRPRILRDLAARLEEGETALPTDVFALLVRELDVRDDDAAIAEAWTEQGEREAEPWVFCRGRAQG